MLLAVSFLNLSSLSLKLACDMQTGYCTCLSVVLSGHTRVPRQQNPYGKNNICRNICAHFPGSQFSLQPLGRCQAEGKRGSNPPCNPLCLAGCLCPGPYGIAAAVRVSSVLPLCLALAAIYTLSQNTPRVQKLGTVSEMELQRNS